MEHPNRSRGVDLIHYVLRSRRRRLQADLARRYHWAEEARNAPTLGSLTEGASG